MNDDLFSSSHVKIPDRLVWNAEPISIVPFALLTPGVRGWYFILPSLPCGFFFPSRTSRYSISRLLSLDARNSYFLFCWVAVHPFEYFITGAYGRYHLCDKLIFLPSSFLRVSLKSSHTTLGDPERVMIDSTTCVIFCTLNFVLFVICYFPYIYPFFHESLGLKLHSYRQTRLLDSCPRNPEDLAIQKRFDETSSTDRKVGWMAKLRRIAMETVFTWVWMHNRPFFNSRTLGLDCRSVHSKSFEHSLSTLNCQYFSFSIPIVDLRQRRTSAGLASLSVGLFHPGVLLWL